jgi:hypothetical protein
MTIELTRRGFMILLGALAASGGVKAEQFVPTKLQTDPTRFGYRVFKDGQEFFRWVEGDAHVNFEFEVTTNTDIFSTSFSDPSRKVMHVSRPDRYFHLNGLTFLVTDMQVVFDEMENIQWLEALNVIEFDPERDRVHHVVGSSTPIISRGI